MKPRTSREDLLKILEGLGTNQAAYPPELLAARRAAFLDQIGQRAPVEESGEEFSPGDRQVVQLLRRLKMVEREHPYRLLAVRRLIFRRQAAQMNRPGFWQTLGAAVQEKLRFRRPTWSASSMNLVLTSLMALSFVAFVSFMVFGSLGPATGFSASHSELVQPPPILATLTQQVKIICKPGYMPPLCLAAEFDRRSDLTFPGNGLAQPAVAKDTVAGYGEIHNAAYVNDGLYGPGASWVSASPDSWIKIDLGKLTTINTVTFGRDRLGQLEGHHPGQFVIAVALTDNVYANGNSSNDDQEYKPVFNSRQAGFNGTVAGADTIVAQFNPIAARYLKITFQNAGAAVDEVEAFLQPVKAGHPTKVAKQHRSDDSAPSPTRTPTPTLTNTPTDTPTPTPTDTPTSTPTDTPTPTPTNTPTSTPTDTPTSTPTNTPLPTDTPTPLPTNTPAPTDTFIGERPFIALTYVPTRSSAP